MAAIRSNTTVGLIEKTVFKRLWRDTEANETESHYRSRADRELLEGFLLDAVERAMSQDITTTRQLAHELQADPKVQAVAEVLTGESAPDLERLFTELIGGEAVPYVAALRYSDTGLEKRADWERTWELQRLEDAGETLDVPVPPKYAQNDFRSQVYWHHRGKLDVPKERFISYPAATSDDDPSPLVGWAGWDHLQQASALAALYQRRKDEDGWELDRLTPLLAGLRELVPWLKQWHNEPDPSYGGERLGDFFASFIAEECRGFGVSTEKLKEWRPPKKTRGRGKNPTPRPPSRRGKGETGPLDTAMPASRRGKGRGRKPALQPAQLMQAMEELGSGGAEVEQRTLVEHLGVSGPAVSKLADQLVAEGKLELTSGRPKRFRVVGGES